MKKNKTLIAAILAMMMLTGCGNTDSNADTVPVIDQNSSIASESEVEVELSLTESSDSLESTGNSSADSSGPDSKASTTVTTTTTAKKTTKATTTTKKTTTTKTTTKKATTTKRQETKQETQKPVTQPVTQPVYTEPVTQPQVTEAPKPVTKATEKPVVTQAPEKKTSTQTSKVTEKPKPAASTLTEGDEPPPGWHSDWVYKPTKGLDVTKSSVMEKYGLTDAEYEAYKDMVRGKTTKKQRMIVRQECIDFIMSKYPRAKLDENGYCFETEDGTPTCDTLQAAYYGPCTFTAHGETSMVTPTYLLGGITQPYAVDWFIRDCHDGVLCSGIDNGVYFNVQVVSYGPDANLGTLNDSAVIGFSLPQIDGQPSYVNTFGKKVKATEQVY